MKSILPTLFVATILTGCATQQAANQIQTDCGDQSGSISAACARKHPSFTKTGQPYQRAVTYRAMLDEQVEAKQLTKAQADVLQQEYQAKIVNEMANQEAAAAVASAPARNAMATTGAALILAGQPRPVQPTNTTCNAFMNTLNCRSY